MNIKTVFTGLTILALSAATAVAESKVKEIAVYPNEIEDVLAGHPGILEAGVVGIEDERSGETVKAVVVAKGQPQDGLVAEIQELVRERLSRHEYPRQVEFVDALPKTQTGKIQRFRLKPDAGRA